MAHGILVPEAIAATQDEAWNRSIICGSALDNGNIVTLTGKSAVAGNSEVFNAFQPTTGSLTGNWMVFAGDEVVLTDSRYKGLDPDVRNFFTAASKVVSAFLPRVGDIILLTGDALASASAANQYAIATTETHQLTWAATSPASTQAWKLLAVKYISLATGAIDSQRVAAYEFECVQP
jgi:hypothetical protein